MIGERDAFMAQSLYTSTGKNIVGVVGMAHMDGIERDLVTKYGFKVATRNCPPPADMKAADKAKARKPALTSQ
jgi:pheromone shutdown protein TraB